MTDENWLSVILIKTVEEVKQWPKWMQQMQTDTAENFPSAHAAFAKTVAKKVEKGAQQLKNRKRS